MKCILHVCDTNQAESSKKKNHFVLIFTLIKEKLYHHHHQTTTIENPFETNKFQKFRTKGEKIVIKLIDHPTEPNQTKTIQTRD